MEHLKRLLAKKKAEGATLDPMQAGAKSSVLREMMGGLDKMGADKLNGLKKVTVASDSPSGLEKGLGMAKEIVEKGPKGLDDVANDGIDQDMDQDMEEETAEGPEGEAQEDEDLGVDGMSPDDLQSHIEKLQSHLERKKMMRS